MPMQVYGAILPGAAAVARPLPEAAVHRRAQAGLSAKARHRLRIIRWYEEHGHNARLSCRHFGLSPSPPCLVYKNFAARDMVSRWDVLEIHRRASAATAESFLDSLQERMPFPVRAIQVDGGSEFEAKFERECERRRIRLFVLPPRSPKLNGHVERAHCTHQGAFYEVADLSWTVSELRPQLLAWERVYNTVRPHQALGYRTPLEVVCGSQRREKG